MKDAISEYERAWDRIYGDIDRNHPPSAAIEVSFTRFKNLLIEGLVDRAELSRYLKISITFNVLLSISLIGFILWLIIK
jgi:hypothetical protein